MLGHRTITTALALAFLAAPLAAQGVSQNVAVGDVAIVAAPAPVAATSAATEGPASPTALGPTRASATVGVRANAAVPAPLPTPYRAGAGRNPAMMIVGGVALLVGAVVGGTAGTIIMISGGVIGLLGLWNYLQ